MGDTNEISKGCLTHYDNRHIQVRLDFLGLCAYDKDLFDEKRKEEPNQECMAKILRLFETLTDHARTGWQLKAINAKEKGLTIPQEPKEYRFELTNGAIISLIYNTFGESTIRNSLDHLVHLGYIGRYQEKKNSIPVYWLNTQKLQPLLKEQAENELSGFEITPQTTKGLKSHPKRPKSNPSSTISNPDPPKSDTSGSESTDNNISNNKDNTTEKDKEESIPAPESLTPTVSPPVVGDSLSGLTQHEHIFTLEGEINEDAIRTVIAQASLDSEGQVTEELIQRTIDAFMHAVFVHRAKPGLSEHPDDQLPGDTHSQQGDAHGQSDSDHRNHQLPGRDHLPVSHFVASTEIEQNTSTPTPAQALPPQSEQAAQGQSAQQNHSAEPSSGAVVGDVPLGNPPAQGAASPKWGIEAMVADAERLREKPFSAIAKPKETKKAQALFKRKPDLTQEEFEDAWKNWDTDWWRKTNGPFTLTDLAATPKDKSEMRLILALEKLALAKANPRQSSQFVSVPRVRVFSSYDDPNFRSDQDFYPVEGGSYAAVSV